MLTLSVTAVNNGDSYNWRLRSIDGAIEAIDVTDGYRRQPLAPSRVLEDSRMIALSRFITTNTKKKPLLH